MPAGRQLPAVTKNRNYPQPVKHLKPAALGDKVGLKAEIKRSNRKSNPSGLWWNGEVIGPSKAANDRKKKAAVKEPAPPKEQPAPSTSPEPDEPPKDEESAPQDAGEEEYEAEEEYADDDDEGTPPAVPQPTARRYVSSVERCCNGFMMHLETNHRNIFGFQVEEALLNGDTTWLAKVEADIAGVVEKADVFRRIIKDEDFRKLMMYTPAGRDDITTSRLVR